MMRCRWIILPAALLLWSLSTLAGDAPSAQCFELRTYYARPGKLNELNSRFRDHACQLFTKHGMDTHGIWIPKDNPDRRLLMLQSYPDRKARDRAWRSLIADPEWQRLCRASMVNDLLLERVENVFLSPTSFSPSIPKDDAEATQGVHELRILTTSEEGMPALQRCYATHFGQILQKHGIEQWGYWTPMQDQRAAGTKLFYLLAYEDLDKAQKAEALVFDDPEWKGIMKDLEKELGGPVTLRGGVTSTLLIPAGYSTDSLSNAAQTRDNMLARTSRRP